MFKKENEVAVVENGNVTEATEKETFKMKAAKIWNSKPVTIGRKVVKVVVPAVAGFVAGLALSKANTGSDSDSDYDDDFVEDSTEESTEE